jgi:hypothetical protein
LLAARFQYNGARLFFWTVRKKKISVWKMEWVEVMFLFLLFFSRDRRFVSSDFLLASLTNSLLFFFANALYPKTHLFFVCSATTYL